MRDEQGVEKADLKRYMLRSLEPRLLIAISATQVDARCLWILPRRQHEKQFCPRVQRYVPTPITVLHNTKLPALGNFTRPVRIMTM